MSIQQNINQLLGQAGVTVGLAKRVYQESPAGQAEAERLKTEREIERVTENRSKFEKQIRDQETSKELFNAFTAGATDPEYKRETSREALDFSGGAVKSAQGAAFEADRLYQLDPSIHNMLGRIKAQRRYQDLLASHTTARDEYSKLYGSLPDTINMEDR